MAGAIHNPAYRFPSRAFSLTPLLGGENTADQEPTTGAGARGFGVHRSIPYASPSLHRTETPREPQALFPIHQPAKRELFVLCCAG